MVDFSNLKAKALALLGRGTTVGRQEENHAVIHPPTYYDEDFLERPRALYTIDEERSLRQNSVTSQTSGSLPVLSPVDTHQIDSQRIAFQPGDTHHPHHQHTRTLSSTSSESLGKSGLYLQPSNVSDGSKTDSPTSSRAFTPWLKRTGHRLSDHYRRNSPESPLWIRIATCFIPLDHFAKLILVLGLTQSGMALLWGVSSYIRQQGFPGSVHLMFPAIQIAWGIFYAFVCIFGMLVMWGNFRRSPTGALCFTITNCLVSVTLVATVIMWFFFAHRGNQNRIKRCRDMTVPTSMMFGAPRRPAPEWAVNECIREGSYMNMWMIVWGVIHAILLYFSVILSYWGYRYWQMVKTITAAEKRKTTEKEASGLADGKREPWTPLDNKPTQEPVPIGTAMPMSAATRDSVVSSNRVSPTMITIPKSARTLDTPVTDSTRTPLTASRMSQYRPTISTSRDSLTSNEERPKSTIIIGNAVFRLAPPTSSPSVKKSPTLSIPPISATNNPSSPSGYSMTGQSFSSRSSIASTPASPPPNTPLPQLPKFPFQIATTVRTIDMSLAGMVLPTPPPPMTPSTPNNPMKTPTSGVLSVGGFEFPIAPTTTNNPTKRRSMSEGAMSEGMQNLAKAAAANASPSTPPPVPQMPKTATATAATTTMGKAEVVASSNGGKGSNVGVVVVPSGRGRVNGFPTAPVRRGTISMGDGGLRRSGSTSSTSSAKSTESQSASAAAGILATASSTELPKAS